MGVRATFIGAEVVHRGQSVGAARAQLGSPLVVWGGAATSTDDVRATRTGILCGGVHSELGVDGVCDAREVFVT